jgi:hypothetical protein
MGVKPRMNNKLRRPLLAILFVAIISLIPTSFVSLLPIDEMRISSQVMWYLGIWSLSFLTIGYVALKAWRNSEKQ